MGLRRVSIQGRTDNCDGLADDDLVLDLRIQGAQGTYGDLVKPCNPVKSVPPLDGIVPGILWNFKGLFCFRLFPDLGFGISSLGSSENFGRLFRGGSALGKRKLLADPEESGISNTIRFGQGVGRSLIPACDG